jgi:dehydration protein DpgD
MSAAADKFTRVRYEKCGHLVTVTLDRPDVLNAMDRRMHAELTEIWDDVESDDSVWAVMICGAGDRAFSVGQDLKELAERDAGEQREVSSFGSAGKPGAPRFTDRFDLTKPVLAKVHGYAIGGGFELAMACDLIVASEDATFALTEARLGLIAGAGGVFRLPRQVPYRVAMGHLLTGRSMSAARAYELGLVNEVVPRAEMDACAAGWLDDILSCAPLAVRAAKQAAIRSLDLPLPDAFHADYPAEVLRMYSSDAVMGPRAFAEKRQPDWLGY